MDGFLSWFFEFFTTMIEGIWKIISGIGGGIVQIFNIPAYFSQFTKFSGSFTIIDWIVSILAFILTFAIWVIIILLIVLGLRKYIRFRRSVVGNEDVLEELAGLHRDVIRLTKEKEQIMALKVGQTSIPVEAINEIFTASHANIKDDDDYIDRTSSISSSNIGAVLDEKREEPAANSMAVPSDSGTVSGENRRFFRLAAVDDKYQYYTPPEYRTDITLDSICTDFRNFACSKMHLYYEEKTIRLMFAGLASTKLILLQGISGTGKTSLPYSMGKFFKNDATIASVQPSWRDRTELFGYFNEFTKRFNETEVLKRIYEASYNDDINIIVLDEMNIARVEYYFAEMLSVLEMPDSSEWKLELVPSSWDNDPKHLSEGKLCIPQNVWYIGTANNDDSTFAVSDKVYDRAVVINLDSKGVPFDAPETESSNISYSSVEQLYKKAVSDNSVDPKYLKLISALDLYIIQKFRVAFGNRIMKQLAVFVPVYVACGGTEMEGIDYMFATKVFRKFESLNLSLICDEIDGLIDQLEKLFGKGNMNDSISYLKRLKKMY